MGYGTVAGRGMKAEAEVDVGQGRRLIDTAMKIRRPATVPRAVLAVEIAIRTDHGEAVARRRTDCFSAVHPLRIKHGVVIIDKP
jgi:hypothetical protein